MIRAEASCNILDLDYDNIDQPEDATDTTQVFLLFTFHFISPRPRQFPAPPGSTTPPSGEEQSSWTLTSSARFGKLERLIFYHFPPSESSPEKVTATSDFPRPHAWRLPRWLHQ